MSFFKQNLFIAAFLTTPFFAFGQDSTVCYKATKALPQPLPNVVCLESIYESGETNVLLIDSKDASLPSSVAITEFIRQTEDRYAFTAEKVLVNVWNPSCESGLWAVLKIAGRSEAGNIRPDRLSISADVKITNDTCHFDPMPETVQYVKVSANN